MILSESRPRGVEAAVVVVVVVLLRLHSYSFLYRVHVERRLAKVSSHKELRPFLVHPVNLRMCGSSHMRTHRVGPADYKVLLKVESIFIYPVDTHIDTGSSFLNNL